MKDQVFLLKWPVCVCYNSNKCSRVVAEKPITRKPVIWITAGANIRDAVIGNQYKPSDQSDLRIQQEMPFIYKIIFLPNKYYVYVYFFTSE